jgi:predicted dehydrogenase
VGIVGAGFMGDTHLAAWAADGVPRSVFDVHPGNAARLATRHGATVARSLDELIAASDVVDICTATHTHADIAVAAARAGRHVICEKPLARTLADADRVIAACASAGVELLVAHVVRYFPEYAAAHERVVAGAVGRPAVLRLRRATYRPRHTAGHWLFDHAKSGGVILDMMIHDFDFARWVAGEVTSIWCRSVGLERPELGVDHAVAILTHASGAISHLSGSWAYGRPDFRTAFEIAGSSGLISHDSALAPVASWLDAADDAGGAVGLPRSPVTLDPYRLQLREFRRRIVDGTPVRVSAQDGREALRIALAADASAREGRAVALEAVE